MKKALLTLLLLPLMANAQVIDKTLAPRVFSGYRNMVKVKHFTSFPDASVSAQVWRDSIYRPSMMASQLAADTQFLDEQTEPLDDPYLGDVFDASAAPVVRYEIPSYADLAFVRGEVTPDWLRNARDAYRFQEDFVYQEMLENPGYIQYAYWDLPMRPTLPEEDTSLRGYLQRLDLPAVIESDVKPEVAETKRINWLHTLNTSLQLSQAFVSKNWYQGGTSYFALLANFLWDVQLNNVFHPNVIFQSTTSYKLSINSTPEDKYHKYSIAQDLFQYNLKAGYKAYQCWYYSFALQFKTQFFNGYPANSMQRTSSFLSPAELNVGLGMTYTKESADKNLKFTASLSPIAYNMRVCIDPKVDHDLLAFPTDRKVVHDYGSTAEVNFFARFWKNSTYTTRFFFFTDYKNFQSDWEHTLNFQISKLFSTQIYVHMRYDSAADPNLVRGWRRFMLKEILSFGLSYNFSTK